VATVFKNVLHESDCGSSDLRFGIADFQNPKSQIETRKIYNIGSWD